MTDIKPKYDPSFAAQTGQPRLPSVADFLNVREPMTDGEREELTARDPQRLDPALRHALGE